MKMREKIKMMGVKIDNLGLHEAVERALTERDTPCWVVTPNAVMLDACHRNTAYRELLNRAELSLADGAGVLLQARRHGAPLRERVAGIDFGEALMARAASEGLRVYLLGSVEGVAEEAAKRLRERYAGLCICGCHHGYFERGGEAEKRVLDAIRRSNADILFVCMGFPGQEEWIDARLDALTSIRVVAGLGGALDVWAGRVKRAPQLFSRLGLEWAWRMLFQPKRIFQLPSLLRVALYFPKRDKNADFQPFESLKILKK